MLRIASLICAGVFAAICGLAGAAPPPDPDGTSATGYMRLDSPIPSDADMSRGDVPRDGYGRPWTYEGLGQKLPDFIAETTAGQSFGAAQLQGQWTVLQVWGIWCHDSMNDAPYAAALADALMADTEVEFVTVHTPQNKKNAHRATRSYASVADWFAERDYSYTTLLDPDAEIRNALKIRWTPSYLVIAPDLSVQGFRTGLADAGDKALEQFLDDIRQTRRAWQRAQND